MGKDIISVIVPCYNAEQYVERCFDSIKNQTYGLDNLEIIFIDDASTDSTHSILNRFHDEYPANVVVLHNECNLFCGGARNVGLDVATGKYVSFVDADDWLDVTALEKMYIKAEENRADMVQCLHKNTYDTDSTAERKGDDRFLNLENDDNRRNYIFSYGSNDSHARLYLRSFIEDNEIRFIDHMFCESIYFTIIGLILLKSVYFLNEELYYYYLHDDSVIHAEYNWERSKTLAEVPALLDDFFAKRGVSEKVKRFWHEYQKVVFDEVYCGNMLRFSAFRDKVISTYNQGFERYLPNMQNNFYFKVYMERGESPFHKQCAKVFKDSLRYETEWGNYSDYVHVCFGLHDRSGGYSRYVGTVMHSILKNTFEAVVFHILVDDTVNEESRNRLRKIAHDGGAYIFFHDLDKTQFQVQQSSINTYSIGTLFRLCIPKILSDVRKIIYLDADIMFNKDIKDLWNVNIDGYAMAGVHDAGFEHGITLAHPIRNGHVQKENYVNAGVLILNLEYIRAQGDLFEMSMEYLNNNPDADLLDQDALNYLFRNHVLLLDRTFNVQTKYERLVSRELNSYVYHYMGEPTIDFNNATEFDKEYLRIQQATPWGYEPVGDELVRGIGRSADRINHLQQLLTAMSKGVKKIYCGAYVQAMESIMSIVPMGDNDYFVDGSCAGTIRNGKPVLDFSAIEAEERGKFVLLIIPDAEDGRIINKLDAMGLTVGVDYFNIYRLMTGDQGGYWT